MESTEDRTSSQEYKREFQRGRLELEVTEMICRLMEEQGITKAELARRLGVSRPYVTKILRDGSNMTLKSISDFFFVMGKSLRVIDRPLSEWTKSLLVAEVHHSPCIATRETTTDRDPGEPDYKVVRRSVPFAVPKGFELELDDASWRRKSN